MVKAITEHEHYLTRVFAGNNQLVVDELAANGGKEKGPAPMDLLAASLASCTGITLRMYADRKQWNIGAVEVSVSIEKEIPIEGTHLERKIVFGEAVSEEQKARLLDIANHCPVHKILTKTILINTLI